MILLVALLYLVVSTDAQCNVEGINLSVGRSYYFSTYYYPYSYPPVSSCYWTAYSYPGTYIHLSCDHFNLDGRGTAQVPCMYSRLYVSQTGDPQLADADYYCGTGSLQISTTTNAFSALFESLSNDRHYSGFHCRITSFADVVEPPSPPTNQDFECGVKGTSRIVQGTETDENEYTWLVSLGTVSGGHIEHFCAGSIIGPKLIMTAAHCAEVYSSDNLVVIVGAHHLYEYPDTEYRAKYTVAQIIIHDEYDAITVDNDIALLRLTRPIIFSDKVRPVCLPEENLKEIYAGGTGWVAGWGTTSFQGSSSSVLNDVSLTIKSRKQCIDLIPESSERITENMFCTYRRGYDACQGDSGGPLVWQKDGKYFAIGVVSWGIGCAQDNEPGVYAKVDNYLDWIEMHKNAIS